MVLARDLTILSAYGVILAVAFLAAYLLRFDLLLPVEQQHVFRNALPFVLCVQLAALALARQVRIVVSFFSMPDLFRVVAAMSGASLVLLALRLLEVPGLTVPRGVLLIDHVLAVTGLCLARISARLLRERLLGRPPAGEDGAFQRIAIIGAGESGASLAKEFLTSPRRGFRPVLFFDDDQSKHGRMVHGLPVVGRPERITELKELPAVSKVVIAMPTAPAARVREIVTLLTRLGIKVETIPSLESLASGRVKASRLRPVEVEDLLGRDPVQLGVAAMQHLIAGRRVLVTGAGGSIGSELCRQIAALQPGRLLLVEQAEGALFHIEQELNERGAGSLIVPLVADVLDGGRMEFIFARYRPDLVFHAAAHKHVYLMERQPAEALRNNLLGTRQLARLALAHGVGAFVFISTDKAINPTSVMGATKRLAELQLMAIAATQGVAAGTKDQGTRDQGPRPGDQTPAAAGSAPQPSALNAQLSPLNSQLPPSPRTKFMAVRFGNVLGSSGSVIPIFRRQIANGGPVTVTHPEVTRYFMTIPEAVGLVLQSFVIGRGGEIFVLDMGRPVKIVDLARQMIELSGLRLGEDIEITYTGLKPGEKFFEELKHDTEEHTATSHPRIMRFSGKAVLPVEAERDFGQDLHALDSKQLKALIQRYVPEYTPHVE
jgi:FlaA1/EpsC-like NDP-sugar epimerase